MIDTTRTRLVESHRTLAQGVLLCAFCALSSLAHGACQAPHSKTKLPPQQKQLVVQDVAGRDVELYSRSIALVIGESNYLGGKTGLRPLASVPREITNLQNALESQGFEVWTYLDLSSAQLQSTIECFIREDLPVDPDMRFLLWFAGHGATLRDGENKRDGFVLPIDIQRPEGKDPEPSEIRRKGLRLSQFIEWSANWIQARHALFVFDSCFSGAVLRPPTRSTAIDKKEKPKPPGYAISGEARQPLREFLSSGTDDEEVPASSIFADYFVKALLGERREADVDGDGLLTGTELVTFLKGSVVQDSFKQTPTSGRLSSESLNRGEIVFALPKRSKRVESVATSSALNSSPAGGLRPVFRGAIDSPSSAGPSIVQFFEAESYLTTTITDCSKDCSADGKSVRYDFKLALPGDAPAGALFDAPELRCLSGPCSAGATILSGPALSTDRRSASVGLVGWGAPSTWRLAARLVVPDTGAKAVVVDRKSGTTKEVDAKVITVAGQAPQLDDGTAKSLAAVVLAMQSDDTSRRRAAREELTKLIDGGKPELVSQLIRQMPVGTYRYQLGVTEALSNAKQGWLTGEASSRTVLERIRDRRCDGMVCESTLHASVVAALANQRLFAYYEVGPDGWLTRAGQLRKTTQSKPPMTPFEAVTVGDVLLADSGVNLRAGVGSAAGIVTTAATGTCLSVVQPDRGYMDAGARGGWLQVKLLKSCQPSRTG
jgi:hypothetical protein